MLNGDGSENGIKINRCDQQRNKLHVQHTFFSNQRKNKFARAALFFVFICRCFAQLQRCFVGLNFLVTDYFYGGIVVRAYLIFCLLCSCSLLFFTAPHFHLAGRQHFSLGPFIRGKIRRVLHKTRTVPFIRACLI